MMWASLLHLSYNMWCDHDLPDSPTPHWCARPYLRCDDGLLHDLTTQMSDAGMNLIVLDLGDAIQYASHPELAVENAWPRAKLKAELSRLRALGLEPVPKLNFSSAHDAWLGPYSRMVSTPTYYGVCRDLIAEIIELFERPRLFHIGMDEETAGHQARFEYAVLRQGDLWWRDLSFYVEEVEKGGARAWMWADFVWHHPEQFLQKMPRSVVQSNWYYGPRFDFENGEDLKEAGWKHTDRSKTRVAAYEVLENGGFDQIPTGSNWITPHNFARTVEFCRPRIAPERLLGFMTTPWHPTLEECRALHQEAIAQVARAKANEDTHE